MSEIAIQSPQMSRAGAVVRLIPERDTLILGSILICIQILDGVLTAIGVGHFGHWIEGNVILRNLMHQIGYIQALIIVKTFAIGVVIALCALASSVSWLNTAVKCVICLYLGAAIIPWSAIIFSKIL